MLSEPITPTKTSVPSKLPTGSKLSTGGKKRRTKKRRTKKRRTKKRRTKKHRTNKRRTRKRKGGGGKHNRMIEKIKNELERRRNNISKQKYDCLMQSDVIEGYVDRQLSDGWNYTTSQLTDIILNDTQC